ncbi:histidine kinase [Nonlabens sp. YIK11]|uniref:sensor histidine kinase n=1 Tax=Nonlabens sp. YIK11 TaxID=1453349 RepID=UPI0006DCAEE9|nr:histidine kinase [Nonlabens sp. YIK11]KQC33011.1 histidine kinase [Nonlabens sp. YIK11]
MSTSLNSPFSRITIREILGVILFYFFFSFLYHIVLGYLGTRDNYSFYDQYLEFPDFWERAGMQYVFYFIGSVVIWFLGIFLFKKYSNYLQIAVVALMVPLFVWLLRDLRYYILDTQDIWHLEGTSQVWDWYIPSLFLWIQFGCFFAYRYFRENKRKLLVEGELRQAALKSELSAIKAQLNPHFLYNVFNTINASLPAENERTRRMIAQLSDIFRYQLKATKQEKVPLHEELDFVTKYLNLEKERFEDRLKIDINVPFELMNEPVPPMLLQPLVENSVKHGLSSLIEGGEISIQIHRENDKLKFVISDTGVGVEDPNALMEKGIGLTNTRLRLQKMYNSTLEILHNDPRGLKIEFTI